MFRTLKTLALSLALVAVPAQAETIRMAVTDIAGLETLQTEFGKFRDVLSQASGVEVQFFPVSSRTAAVEALKAKKIDLVLTGPAEYVVINKLTKAYPIIGFSRPDYFAALVTMADSGINSPADLKGRKVAFGDVGSTSKHLAPAQLLADANVAMKDVQVTHVSPNVGWEAMKRGDVAAVGMTYTNYLKARDKDSLEPGAFRVIARGPDLPNDVLMAGAHVDKALLDKVRKAFDSHGKQLIEAMLVGEENKKYRGMKFIPTVKDADYNYVRAMYKTIGQAELARFPGE